MSLAKLFGAKKKDPKEEANQSLSKVADTLLKRQTHLEFKINQEKDLAKQYGAANNKKVALEHVRRMKQYQEQLRQNDGILMNIHSQQFAMNSVALNKEVLDTMILASNAMKKEHHNLDPDKVQDTLDDIREQNEIAKEISEAISGNVGYNTFDDDELEAELEALSAQDQLTNVDDINLPSVPTGELKPEKSTAKARPKAAKEKDDISGLLDWAS